MPEIFSDFISIGTAIRISIHPIWVVIPLLGYFIYRLIRWIMAKRDFVNPDDDF
jgi:hypothetical protein